jgi:hypothetical protein
MPLNSIRALPKTHIDIDSYVTGWIAAQDLERGILVDFKANTGGAIPARTTLLLDELTVQRAIETQQAVLLVFEHGDPELPILIGLLQPTVRAQAPAVEPCTLEQLPRDARRVALQGRDEVVLRCGKASITLRRNGAIVIRGAHLVSQSSGINRIRGGSVQIN